MGSDGGRDAGSLGEAAVCVVRPMRSFDGAAVGDGWGRVLLRGVLAVTGTTAGELAESAGCGAGLLGDIESGRVRPAWETLERLANAVGLELRVGVRTGAGSVEVSDRFDCGGERVRRALEEANAWRAGLGLGSLAPPAGTVPPWDGADPAPARQVCAWPHRTDFGGHAAINVRYGRNCVLRIDETSFAGAVGLTLSELSDIESGRVSLSLDDTERLLNRVGLEQFAHLELYDDHDDLLHLAAVADHARRHGSLARAR